MTSMFSECRKKPKKKMVYDLSKIIESDDRFLLILNEWTSNRNRKYMCLNLHSSDSSVQCFGWLAQ